MKNSSHNYMPGWLFVLSGIILVLTGYLITQKYIYPVFFVFLIIWLLCGVFLLRSFKFWQKADTFNVPSALTVKHISKTITLSQNPGGLFKDLLENIQSEFSDWECAGFYLDKTKKYLQPVSSMAFPSWCKGNSIELTQELESLLQKIEGPDLITSSSPFYNFFLLKEDGITILTVGEGEQLQGVILVRHHAGLPIPPKMGAILAAILSQAATAIKNLTLVQDLARTNKELEDAHEALKEAQARLIQTSKMGAIGQLAAGIAHELNTPLASIQSNIQSILAKTKEEKQREQLALAEKGVKKCQEIVSHLLMFSRKKEGEGEWVEISKVIEEAMLFTQHLLRDKDVQFETSCEDIPPIKGNLSELVQVFINLITNAIDAISFADLQIADFKKQEIKIKAYKELENIIIKIADTGGGIPKDNISKIFEPFFTTKEPGKGTGLGLYMVHEIIKNLGGEITVDSTVGAGTTITIVLPLC